MQHKTLVIINGVTGAIGSACLSAFGRNPTVTVVGLSRRARPYQDFFVAGVLPDATRVCSIGDIADRDTCELFVRTLNMSQYARIVYIHAVGSYPFEVDASGRIVVSSDADGDGIDDQVMRLSHTAFFAMTDALAAADVSVDAFLFSSISDTHRPAVHASWWRTMDIIRRDMRSRIQNVNTTRYAIVAISSVFCPHELISRPFVFQNTDAAAQYWLTPEEVAHTVMQISESHRAELYSEIRLFHPSNYYHNNYYSDEVFTQRKLAELGIEVNQDSDSNDRA